MATVSSRGSVSSETYSYILSGRIHDTSVKQAVRQSAFHPVSHAICSALLRGNNNFVRKAAAVSTPAKEQGPKLIAEKLLVVINVSGLI